MPDDPLKMTTEKWQIVLGQRFGKMAALIEWRREHMEPEAFAEWLKGVRDGHNPRDEQQLELT